MCEGKAEIRVITVDERSLHKGDLSEQVGVLDVDEYKRLADERENAVNAGSARGSPYPEFPDTTRSCGQSTVSPSSPL